MSRSFVIGIVVVGLLAAGGWVMAQQDGPGAKGLIKGPVPGPGQFAVSPAGQSAVLLDTKSGKTWLLTRSVDGHSVWLPVRRIDSEQDAELWELRERELRERQRKKNLEQPKSPE